MRLPPVEKNVTIGQNLKAANVYSTLPEVDLISLDVDKVFIGNTNSMIDYAGTTDRLCWNNCHNNADHLPIEQPESSSVYFRGIPHIYSAKLTHKSRF